MVHDHVLKAAEVLALYQMTNRVFDSATLCPENDLVGDVNNDGEVGIGDIVAITNVMAGITTDPAIISRADVNGDTEVGIGDIVAITNIMAGVSQ